MRCSLDLLRRTHLRRHVSCLALCSLICRPAAAETGVSDERVSLPDGPGSIGGVGENASASGNMGAMTYAVPIEVPAGFATATPALELSYSSVGGSGELGIGWELRVPHIERSSLRGLPTYDSDDLFAADGHDELVRIGSDPQGNHTYRARFEGGFVQYLWHADEAGNAGYWEAQYPDGSRGFFGADARGVAVPSARVTDPQGGVFRYLLVEARDRFEHSVRYDYELHGDYPLLSQVRYLFLQGEARYRVALQYAERPDVLSSALAGFELRLTKRLSGLEVFNGKTRLGRYALSYEQVAAGVSRLTSVRRFGLNDELSPIAFTFGYSSALDVSCRDCQRPFVYEMGSLQASESGGVDLQNRRSTLIDINGDALPDVLDTGVDGRHRFFLNSMREDGSQYFSTPIASKLTPDGSAFQLNAPGVQVVDINGDGFADMIHAGVNRVLCNQGQGDWVQDGHCASQVAIADLTEDPSGGGPDPLHLRFMDYDGDKRMDLLHTVADDSARVLHNLPGGFVPKSVEPIGAMFDDSPLQLADLNGDGLLDPVTVGASGSAGVVRYRLNLGHGRWTPFVERLVAGATASELATAELQDLNGDGLDDVVIVGGDSVRIALNQARSFLPFVTLRSGDVTGGELPIFDKSITVLFADMNGSGSTDVVWVEASGRVRVLELFPVRPNLLTRIENGIGGVQLVEYGTSARELARDQTAGQSWRHKLPYAMNVVTATERFASLTPNVRQRAEYVYRHGFYDGLEKRYRGFELIEEVEPGDETQESGHTISEYDVGASDPYYSGRLLREQVFAGEAKERYRIQRVLHEHEDCELSGVPAAGPRLDVRYVCETGVETLLQEGRPAAEWVTLRTTRTYDGYGNVTASSELGVVGMGEHGADACAPCTAPEGTLSGACGPECLGDERFVETSYIAPGDATGGAWVLGRVARQIGYGDPRGPVIEQLAYYDGEPFVGLHQGTLRSERAGLVRRICARQTEQAQSDCQGPGWMIAQRNDHDAHGNVVQALDPLGDPQDFSGHRRHIEYDPSGLRATAVEVLLSNEHGNYRLRGEVQYAPPFDLPSAVSRFQLVGAPVQSEAALTRIAYDNFGRRKAIAAPGDTLEAPSSEFEYRLSAPVSEIVVRKRTKSGAPADLEQRHCVDGFGRTVQTRTRLSDGVYQATGFHEVNPRGLPVRVYDSYQGPSPCDAKPPAEVPYTAHFYDAAGRPLRTTAPDASLYGEPSVSSVVYAPLRTLSFDAEDSDPHSPAFNTPVTQYSDGLGQVVKMERAAADKNGTGTLRLLYDTLGNLTATVDSAGKIKWQQHDLLGRLIHLEDPNAGSTDFVYDLAGNLTAQTDARGVTVSSEYDGANRLVAHFDASARAATELRTRYDFALDCAECTHAEGNIVIVDYPLGPDSARGRDESGFDLHGRSVFAARTLEGHRFVTRRSYDDAGRETSTTYPDGTTLSSHRDGGSRLQSIDGVLSAIDYDERGLMRGVHYENGVHWALDFDVLERVQRARTIDPKGRVLQGFAYSHDRLGNLLGVDDVSGSREPALSRGVRYELDAWHRLTRARFDDGEQVDMRFDTIDNILSRVSSRGARSGAHVGDYRYDSARPNAVSEAGDLHYAYDPAGRTVSRGETTLDWDHEGRVKTAASADRVTHYAYGEGAERVLEWGPGGRIYRIGPDFEVRDGISVTYARLDSRRVARIVTSKLATTLLSDLAPSGGDGRIDVADAWLAVREVRSPGDHLNAAARRLLLEDGPSRVFLHGDHLQSLILATGPEGELLGDQSYYESGELRASAGYVDAYGFGGQRHDPHTGLTHYRFRDLDPRIARWTSPDPLFAVARSELLPRWGEATAAYAYVGNRHASELDPTGLFSVNAVRKVATGVPTGAAVGASLSLTVGRQVAGVVARQTQQRHGGTWGRVLGAVKGLLLGMLATVGSAPPLTFLGAAFGAVEGPEEAVAALKLPHVLPPLVRSGFNTLQAMHNNTAEFDHVRQRIRNDMPPLNGLRKIPKMVRLALKGDSDRFRLEAGTKRFWESSKRDGRFSMSGFVLAAPEFEAALRNTFTVGDLN